MCANHKIKVETSRCFATSKNQGLVNYAANNNNNTKLVSN